MKSIPAFVRESRQEFQRAAAPRGRQLLARLRHPMAPFYARMEDFLTQLQFDAGPEFRYYPALDKRNFSMFSRPGVDQAGARHGLAPQQLIGRTAVASGRYLLAPGERHFYTSDQILLNKAAAALGARTALYEADDALYFMAHTPICNETGLRTTRETLHLYHAGASCPAPARGAGAVAAGDAGGNRRARRLAVKDEQ